MNRKSQTGFGVVGVIIIILVIVVAGLVGWLTFTRSQPQQGDNQQTEEKQKEVEKEKASVTKEYTDENLGITFSYPKTWVTLKCEGRDNALYMASDNRGIGKQGESSILCGGGTDFPPQISFQSVDKANVYYPEFKPDELVIDGKNALKYVVLAEGDGLSVAGFETTTYYIGRDTDVLVITYSKWPTGTEGYDISPESKAKFTEIIESSLKFISE